MIPKDMLMEAAKRKGLSNKEHMEKDYFQDLFLYNLCRKTNMLAFKGGTALYKIYSLPRFSEDLDFSLLGKIDAKHIVEEAAVATGMGVKDSKEMKGSMLIKLGFKGQLTGYNTLRIDISTGNPVLMGFDVKTHIPAYADINPFSIRVMKPEEMLAEKVHSLMAREKARDLYDMFFLLRIAKVDNALIRAKLQNFGMDFDLAALKKRIGSLERVWVPELRPFVLAELPEFRTARDFVIGRLKAVK